MRLLVTGPQGPGKTTQARLLAEHFGLCVVKTGDLMRELSQQDSAEGRSVKKSLDEGDLVDDKIVAKVVEDKLKSPLCVGGFVADGFPRSLDQLNEFDPNYDQVFFLKLSEAEVRERLLKRGREDDTPELIEERLKNYYQHTQPVIDHYKTRGVLVEIEAGGSIEQTQAKIRKSVKLKTTLVKKEPDLEVLRRCGKISFLALQKVLENVRDGVSLLELDHIADLEFKKNQAAASFRTVPGYFHATCLTVNDEVVHGLPRDIKLKNGDLLAIDLGAVYQGWHTDLAWTVVVGEEIDEGKKHFLETGKAALAQAINKAVEGNKIGDISATIQKIVEERGFNVVRSLAGHGVGRMGHEEPEVPTFGKFGQGMELKAGMVLAIEAIYTNGSGEVFVKDDGWTIATTDGGWGGLFEMSVIVGEKQAPEVITGPIEALP